MSTQAEKIRLLAVDLLKNRSLNEPVDNDLYGIRYSQLKKKIMEDSNHEFTDGAVTGALYTLTERVENIYKIKNNHGTYFYYSEDYKDNLEITRESITTSEEYKDLTDMIKNSEVKVREILRNASQGRYTETTNLDIEHLRKLLNLTDQLSNLLKTYEAEKSFEAMENYRYSQFDNLPF